jgi:hypothetical protein
MEIGAAMIFLAPVACLVVLLYQARRKRGSKPLLIEIESDD